MADRVDYYFRQRVTEAELDLAFELLEKADRNLASDIGVFGVVGGAVPTQHAPVADLTIDLTAPGRAYDRLGQRIFFGTGQRVDCTVDFTGIPTEVTTAGRERWLGVFLRFTRQLSDPRTDGNSQQVMFRRDESFELVVRQGVEAPAGSAVKVPLEEDELLVCDVRRRAGQTQITNADIDLGRRQAFIFAQGTSVAVASGAWLALSSSAPHVQAALDSADAVLRAHLTGQAGSRHAATDISCTPTGFLTATNVGAALAELVADLSATTLNNAGAALIGADTMTGTPHTIGAGTVDGQMIQLLQLHNNHVAATTNAHAAAAIGVLDAGNNLTATNVETALAEVVDAFEADHFRGNETSPGQHRAIRQPALGTGRVLIWDSQGAGGPAGRFRMYSDADAVWLILNASWNGSAWVRDAAGQPVGGLYLSRNDFNVFHENTPAPAFTTWSRTWRLPIGSPTNSAWETTGTVQEVGRCGLRITNPLSANWTVVNTACGVTFRSRFASTPTSVTFNRLDASTTIPAVTGLVANRDGFMFNMSVLSIDPAATVWWFGEYTAVA